MIYIFLILGLAVLLFVIFTKFKMPKCDSLVCVNGGVKSGKSTFSFALAYKLYKRAIFKWRVKCIFYKVCNFFRKKKKELPEKPLFYTTIPVSVPHVLLTFDLMKRLKRFAYKSVIWVDEASLLCDSQSYKDLDVNDRLLFFNKLIAHETRGGSIVYNTQSISDLHYSVKRCISKTFFVHRTIKWIPFFLIITVREERYSDDNSAISVYNEDLEDSLRYVIVSKSVWKKFDCYCYSVLTDDLPCEDTLHENKYSDLKARKILSFNERHNIDVGGDDK